MIRMHTKLRRPLDQFVKCLWHSDSEPHPHEKERLLPTGAVDLIFKLQENSAVRIFDDAGCDSRHFPGGIVLSGAYSRFFCLDTTQPSPTLGVHFRPGGAAPFLNVPISELMNQHVGMEEIGTSLAAGLRERLMNAPSVTSLFSIVEQTLLDQLTELPRDYRAIMKTAGDFENVRTTTVQAACDSIGYGSKRFIRRFHDYVGLTPKLFCRIQRFQSALDQINSNKKVEWGNVALDNGYFDQSHLIRDFRAFAGVTPAEYRPVTPGRKNHMVFEP